jgi:hypothetical protein
MEKASFFGKEARFHLLEKKQKYRIKEFEII